MDLHLDKLQSLGCGREEDCQFIGNRQDITDLLVAVGRDRACLKEGPVLATEDLA
jgi:hypothetical protein